MNKRMIMAIMIFATIVVLGIEFYNKTKNGGLTEDQSNLTNQKTYEQGYWIGVNATLEYIIATKQANGDTLHIDIHALDSIFTNKTQQLEYRKTKD
jgi:hypothetical protein